MSVIPRLWHGLGPVDMPLEAKRFGHVAVAVPVFASAGIVTMSQRQQSTESLARRISSPVSTAKKVARLRGRHVTRRNRSGMCGCLSVEQRVDVGVKETGHFLLLAAHPPIVVQRCRGSLGVGIVAAEHEHVAGHLGQLLGVLV
jgi:hypothetical protein